MKVAIRRATCALAAAGLLAYGFHELIVYPTEWKLAEANARIDQALRREGDRDQSASVRRALQLAQSAMQAAPDDPRAVLAVGTALTLLRRGGEASALLSPVVARAERPELLVALGRARASVGDDAAAHEAFLRAAWTSPTAIKTLPKAVRQTLLDQIEMLDTELREGRMKRAPPLPMAR